MVINYVRYYLYKYHMSGQGAIILLTQSGGYDNPVDLIKKNADYLSHHFTTRLWAISHNPEVLNALKVVMNLHVSDDLLQSFHGAVSDVSHTNNYNDKYIKMID